MKNNITRVVDALQESLLWMKGYEKKFGITSVEFLTGEYDINIPTDVQCLWEFYIECYIDCGGELTNSIDNNANIILEDTISGMIEKELLTNKDTERGRDFKLSLPLFLLKWFA